VTRPARCAASDFESEEALAAFRDTELAWTIAGAYEAIDVRCEVLYGLWPERGSYAEVKVEAATP